MPQWRGVMRLRHGNVKREGGRGESAQRQGYHHHGCESGVEKEERSERRESGIVSRGDEVINMKHEIMNAT